MSLILQLASQSPRRRELLAQIGVPYRVLTVLVEEQHREGEAPRDYAQRLARGKAEAGARLVADMPCLGADTIVVCAGQILEKPRDFADFSRMMALLSGREHQVITAIHVCFGERDWSALSVTQVRFFPLDEAMIARYWASGEPRDKAGGYAIQGLGAALVQAIHGSYSGVVGLPIDALVPILQQIPLPYWRAVAGVDDNALDK